MATNVGKNEYGREITYTIYYSDKDSKPKYHDIKGKRFNKAKIIKECKAKGIESPVRVRWVTMNKWGFRNNNKLVKWEE
ncbi:MAG: hypothetical protein ACTSVR_05440 [Candidatus Thorarchaeota archaeon]